MSQRRVEERFRVLTLTTDVDKDVLNFISRYQVLASHIYWARRPGISPDLSVLEKLRSEVKAYWRWHVIDEGNPMYLFKGIEKTPRALLSHPQTATG